MVPLDCLGLHTVYAPLKVVHMVFFLAENPLFSYIECTIPDEVVVLILRGIIINTKSRASPFPARLKYLSPNVVPYSTPGTIMYIYEA